MKYIYLLFLLSFATSIHAQQTPTIVWQKNLGGTNSDLSESLYLAPDGMVYINGTTFSRNYDIKGLKGMSSMWLCKLDTTGYMYWSQCYGSSQFSSGLSLATAKDGVLLIGSVTGNDMDVTSSKGQNDIWAVKVDDNGTIIKDINYGGSGFDRAYAGVSDVDGGYVFCGTAFSTDGDIDINKKKGGGSGWVVKVDTSGSIAWQNFVNDSTGIPYIYGIEQTNDSGVVLVGTSGGDVFASKFDKVGAQQWIVKYGGDSTQEYLYDICDAGDGGYMAVGFSKSSNGDLDTNYGEEDVWLIKLDDKGGLVWQRNYGGTKVDIAYKVIQCLEGGFLILGETQSNDIDVSGNHNAHGSSDIWVVKVDDTGVIEWQKCLGGTNAESGRDVIQMQSGNFLICGQAESWTGDLNQNHGSYDAWVLKLSNPYIVSTKSVLNNNSFSAYPNPANDRLIVSVDRPVNGELQLLDIQGKVIKSIALSKQAKQYHVDVQDVPAGNYYLRLNSDDKELTKQLTIVH